MKIMLLLNPVIPACSWPESIVLIATLFDIGSIFDGNDCSYSHIIFTPPMTFDTDIRRMTIRY